MEKLLFFSHHTLNLFWGVLLSAVFCGVRLKKRNVFIVLLIFVLCGISQLSTFIFSAGNEQIVWRLYPLVVHLPLIALLGLIYKRNIMTVIASVTLAYLCCQPSKWFGLLFETFFNTSVVVWCVKIFVAVIVAVLTLKYFAAYISKIFNKDIRSVLIFSSVPIIYYIFDYVVGVYTDLWVSHYRLAAEFLSFSLCVFFILFCIVYYKEYEEKIEAQHKEEIIRITSEQQNREVENIKKSTFETSLLRHDMRLLLSNLAVSIENNDKETSLKMIHGFVSQVEAAALHRYCKNDTINYILTNFESRCKENKTEFSAVVETDDINVDEILFSSIISNALDNALNAQEGVSSDRQIRFMLKKNDGKLLLSVRNTFKIQPVFVDGLPLTDKQGHGFGTQSIRYMTEKLGGKCQFTTQNDMFVLRVMI